MKPIIFLASESAIKRRAVELAAPGCEVRTVKTESGVSAQPLGLEETFAGAYNRAKAAFFLDMPGGIYVGVESGLAYVGADNYLDVGCIVVIDATEKRVAIHRGICPSVGLVSARFLTCLDRQTQTVGDVLAGPEFDGKDLQSFFTNGQYTRLDSLVTGLQAVFRLIPSLRSES